MFLKDPALEPRLGELLAEMLEVMTDRGPDSAGFAVYGSGLPGVVKLTLRGPQGTDFAALRAALEGQLKIPVAMTPKDTHAVFALEANAAAATRLWLAQTAPDISIFGEGARMELYKEIGPPAAVARRFGLASMRGTHGIGHTRMATESAVTTQGAHPYSTGVDQCLVHNGSLSNHNELRRTLERRGVSFSTENDTEVAAAYLTHHINSGDTLSAALNRSIHDLDGFYTFVVGTENGFGVLRDPIACKPAVMAETDAYVAFGSEYRVLVNLPGIGQAHVFEPEPVRAYFWGRNA